MSIMDTTVTIAADVAAQLVQAATAAAPGDTGGPDACARSGGRPAGGPRAADRGGGRGGADPARGAVRPPQVAAGVTIVI